MQASKLKKQKKKKIQNKTISVGYGHLCIIYREFDFRKEKCIFTI